MQINNVVRLQHNNNFFQILLRNSIIFHYSIQKLIIFYAFYNEIVNISSTLFTQNHNRSHQQQQHILCICRYMSK